MDERKTSKEMLKETIRTNERCKASLVCLSMVIKGISFPLFFTYLNFLFSVSTNMFPISRGMRKISIAGINLLTMIADMATIIP